MSNCCSYGTLLHFSLKVLWGEPPSNFCPTNLQYKKTSFEKKTARAPPFPAPNRLSPRHRLPRHEVVHRLIDGLRGLQQLLRARLRAVLAALAASRRSRSRAGARLGLQENLQGNGPKTPLIGRFPEDVPVTQPFDTYVSSPFAPPPAP